MDRWYNEESTRLAGRARKDSIQRRDFFKLGMSVAGAVGKGVGFTSIAAAVLHTERTSGPPLNATSEAENIAFDRIGSGVKVLLISGFPQTRRSWNRLIPLLSLRFQLIPADLPSAGSFARRFPERSIKIAPARAADLSCQPHSGC
jgi:pimeloyl-ACP methyl ester carboxylesterase